VGRALTKIVSQVSSGIAAQATAGSAKDLSRAGLAGNFRQKDLLNNGCKPIMWLNYIERGR
jgi:hypothetical protein